VLANDYSAPLLRALTQENAQNRHDPIELPNNSRGNSVTPIIAGLFVDGPLYIASKDLTINTGKLQKAFNRVITWAARNRLKINMNKVDYMCFT
jgi:hypothetical protein